MSLFSGTTVPLFILLASMLIITMMRVAVPVGQTIKGKAISHVSLNYRERLLLQRTNIYAIVTVLLITSIAGLMPLAVELAVVGGAFVIIMMPVRYTFTTEGVALNNVVFRKWSEFSGYELRGSRIRLLGRDGNASYTISLMSARRPETVQMVERLVSGHAPEKAKRTPTARGVRARSAVPR